MGHGVKFVAGLGASCVALLLALFPSSAAAAPKPITGKLSKPDYTVIAVGARGQEAVRAKRGRFKLKLRGRSRAGQGVSLHLRAPNGAYAGPVVIASKRKGRRAILGVRAGARLGGIKIGRGYARVKKRLRRKWVDRSRTARARKGVPIGARVFGRVRSRPPRNPVPGDRDFDGIPDPLDIDDDGDLILDDVDRSRAARAAQEVFDSPFLHHFLELSLANTVNANAGFTDEQIEQPFFGAVEIRSSALFIGLPEAASTELDCGRDDPATPQREGLIYCSTGNPPSKGRILRIGPGHPAESFPECCDPGTGDPPGGDGFGTLVEAGHNQRVGMDLHFTATTAEMKSGDVLIRRINDANGVEVASFSNTLQYVFATVPALVSYRDTVGNAGTVSYPVAEGSPPPGPPGGPGTNRNGFPVAAGPDGVVLTLTFWQPQRRPIGQGNNKEACLADTPPCRWVDIGGLTYSAVVVATPDPSMPFVTRNCPQDAYSVPQGQPFSPSTPPAGPGLTDTLGDRAANPANKITYTLNLTKCLGGLPWSTGQAASVHFRASGIPKLPGGDAGHSTQFYVTFTLK
jgi:hypothetical protein